MRINISLGIHLPAEGREPKAIQSIRVPNGISTKHVSWDASQSGELCRWSLSRQGNLWQLRKVLLRRFGNPVGADCGVSSNAQCLYQLAGFGWLRELCVTIIVWRCPKADNSIIHSVAMRIANDSAELIEFAQVMGIVGQRSRLEGNGVCD